MDAGTAGFVADSLQEDTARKKMMITNRNGLSSPIDAPALSPYAQR